MLPGGELEGTMSSENTQPCKQDRKKFNRNVVVAGLVSLFTDIASEMIVPVLPLFLVGSLHASTTMVGLIEGIAETTASLLKVFSGWLSDLAGRRKPLMLAGYGLSNLVRPLFGLAAGWGHVLVIKFSDKVGKGLRTAPRDALLADSAVDGQTGKAFGLHRALDTLGGALGPLLAFALLGYWGGDYRQVFFWTAVPGTIALLLIVFGLKEARPTAHEKKSVPHLGFAGLGRNFLAFAFISTLFALGNSSDAFLILRARDLGMAVALIPLSYFVFNLTYSILSYPLGSLSDRVGKKPLLIMGFIMFALVYMGFALAHAQWHVWALFIFYGLYCALTEGIQRAYVADLVPQGKRGMAMGTFNALIGMAALPASIIAGYLWKLFGPLATFSFGSITACVSALLLLFCIPRESANHSGA